jgi:hypothetical protein
MALAAMSLARRGLHVFPLRTGTKDGHRGSWKQLATADPDFVLAHWKRFPDDNIGIATGAHDGDAAGWLVLDVDIKGGKKGPESLAALELEYGKLPPTRTATTASGGLHYYFRVDVARHGKVANSIEKLGEGLDVRGDGGYVVAPPSIVAGVGRYKWADAVAPADAPGWLIDLAGKPRDRDELRDEPAAELDTEYNLARVAKYLRDDAKVAVQGEGGNGVTYAVACMARELGASKEATLELMLEHYNDRCEPPWDVDELEEVVEHADTYAKERPGAAAPGADFPEDEEPPSAEAAPSTGVYNDWVWIAGPKWFVRRSDGRRLDKASMDSAFDYTTEGKTHFSDTVFNSRAIMRKFLSLQFRPGAPEFLGEEYNLWKDTGCASEPGDASWLQEHVEYMCGDEADLVLDYMAHLTRNRGVKLSYALLIQGGQGIGKSFLGSLMRRILGRTNVEFPTNEELHSNFTEWALGRELVVIQELMAQGRQQMANKLKPLITEDYVRVEEKHRTPYTVENHMNFLVFTNHEDPIPLERDDRRFAVVMSKAKPRDNTYYDVLFDRIITGKGAEHAKHWLSQRDLSNFNPKGRAPETAAKERMRRAGLSDVEAFLLERFEEGETPFDCDLVTTRELEDCLQERLTRAPRIKNTVLKFLRTELEAKELGRHWLDKERSARLRFWSVRRHEMMAALTPAERVKIWQRAREGGDFLEDIGA